MISNRWTSATNSNTLLYIYIFFLSHIGYCRFELPRNHQSNPLFVHVQKLRTGRAGGYQREAAYLPCLPSPTQPQQNKESWSIVPQQIGIPGFPEVDAVVTRDDESLVWAKIPPPRLEEASLFVYKRRNKKAKATHEPVRAPS